MTQPENQEVYFRLNQFFDGDLRMKDLIKSYGPDFGEGLYLSSIQEYKKFLLKKSLEKKEEILTLPLSRFLWVMRTYYKNQPLWDSVYDSTSVYPKKLTSVYYKLPV